MKKLPEFQNFLKKYTDIIERAEYAESKEDTSKIYVIVEIPFKIMDLNGNLNFVDCINSLTTDYNARLCLSSNQKYLRYGLFVEC